MKNKLLERIKEYIHYFTEEIWVVEHEELSKTKSFFIRQVKIFILAIKGFSKDRIQLRASALTLYTLLSVVPVVSLIFAIAKGFGIESIIQQELIHSFQGQEEVLNWIIEYANNFLENTKSGYLAGIGIVILIWSVIQVLGNIESAFNRIWQIKKSRSYVRKFTDYLTVILVAPVFMVLASTLTVSISGALNRISEAYPILEHLSFIIGALPFVIVWFLFAFIYMVMPNTKVHFKSAFIAGLIAGTMFQFTQWGYIYFQIGVSKYGAVYGSLAALPLFIIWMQISWLIVLLGAEISFANQNVNLYEYESDSLLLSPRLKKILTFMVANLVVQNFEEGEEPLTSTEISRKLKIPVRLVREIVDALVNVKIFSELILEDQKERAYQPAIDIHKITFGMIKYRLEDMGSHHIQPLKSKEYKRILQMMDEAQELLENSDKNLLIKDL
jgi:membrane protein